ncbi:26S protease regulatory subunit S10B like B [Apostasia shenzhenica]|uniref:26S protease regulatory subunit S10B like B n=1 Tax=Apostasia shenzhenica TaxID=1088818 RepID=A0A2I0A1E0_9ASPA|nr:26S protease regulatory subunit S10B like B [Apostasia shenzhenica]
MGVLEEKWAGWGSVMASLMFLWAVVSQYFSHWLGDYLSPCASKLLSFVYPYIEITFFEFAGERLKRSNAYAAVESYLVASCSATARRLKADDGRDGAGIVLSMNEYEEVTDEFAGAKVWWSSQKLSPKTPSFSLYPAPPERSFYRLTFHRRHRNLVTKSYVRHVLEQGKAIGLRNRQRKLYTNSSQYDEDWRKKSWSHVPFEHPATFDTIAIDPAKKREIVEDLLAFSRGKEFYAHVGKPWKRGYLLHGPPGTGKSTMISAMANLLDYDVYDLELTAVKNNSELRKLLLEITSKAIIVIEDIDCSLDLSGKRKKGTAAEAEKSKEEKKMMGREDNPDSKVTLSGLLNFIDGLWSACGGEKLIVFTTNHVKKLDPALIRRGRMDMHIELSYCDFESFKVLAKNYLGIEGGHPLFDEIRRLMEERNITPADVAEALMPKTMTEVSRSVEVCLHSLIEALRESKLKSEKEAGEEEVAEEEKSSCTKETKEADNHTASKAETQKEDAALDSSS